MDIFRACDVRGIYPDEINEDKAYRIGRAIATELEWKTVVVAGDVRTSSPSLKDALIEGITASSCDAIDIGTVPTPTLNFAKERLGTTASVMVTASHNPPEHNGLKITMGKLPITEKELRHLRGLAENHAFLSRRGKRHSVDISSDYEDHVAARGEQLLADVSHSPKIVLDCGNGCCSEIAPRVLARLGLPVVPLFCEIDGTFPNRSPDSAIPENLSDLRRSVLDMQADLGIAFDGDGDRVSFVDENGDVLRADVAGAIIATHMPEPVTKGDKVVLDQKCSAALFDTIRTADGQPITEKSGHTFIKTRMIEDQAKLGVEVSGHFFYSSLGGADDGLYSALVMTGIVGRDGKLSDLAARVPKYVSTPDLRVSVPPNPELLDRIASVFPSEHVSRLDGVRVAFENGWGLARISVTEPIMTLRFEGRDRTSLRQIMAAFLAAAPELAAAIRERYGSLDKL